MEKPTPIFLQDQFVPLLNTLLALLHDLSREEWQRPTACAGWTVHDVALHLLGGDLGLLSRQRDGYTPGEVTIDSYEELVALINRLNADWLAATRRLSPTVVTGLLGWSGQQVADYLQSLDPHAITGPVNWAGPEPAPVWLDVAREYTERWHHQQHIRDAVGRPGMIAEEIMRPILATFAHALPETYRAVEAPAGTTITLHIRDLDRWSIRREDNQWHLYHGAPVAPDAVVTLNADAAWRLFTNGLSLPQARQSATLSGDPEMAGHLLRAKAILA